MRLILSGVLLMLAGFSLLFAMVARWLEPGLGLSVLAFAATFGGMLTGLIGLDRLVRGTRHPPGPVKAPPKKCPPK